MYIYMYINTVVSIAYMYIHTLVIIVYMYMYMYINTVVVGGLGVWSCRTL